MSELIRKHVWKLPFLFIIAFLLISLMSLETAAEEGEITYIYVNDDATGSNNGTTWEDAYTDLMVAIKHAEAGNHIWVAEGTYTPINLNDNNRYSFSMKSGVEIYGGFAGNEVPHAHYDVRDRDFRGNETILKGNGDPVIYNFFPQVDETAVLDGFTITGAHHDKEVASYGGGIFNSRSSPTLRNLIIKNNYAAEGGAGIYNTESSPRIENVIITDNSSEKCGAGLFNLYSSSPLLINVLITHNSSNLYGDGMCNSSNSSPDLRNVTITDNNGDGITNFGSSKPTVRNSIIYNNDIYNHNDGSETIISDSMIGEDPHFVNPSERNYRLASDSPAIGAGSPSLYNDHLEIWSDGRDLDGRSRFVELTPEKSIIDLGAYQTGYHISIEAYTTDAGGYVSGGTGWFAIGAQTTLKAVADTGYAFLAWKEDGQVVSTDANYTFTVNRDRHLSVHFERTDGFLQINIEPQEVVDAGAQWYRYNDNTWYDSGQEVPVQVGDTGYSMESVILKDIPGWETPKVNSLYVEPKIKVTETATYVRKKYTISATVNPTGGGQILAGGEGTYDHGSQVSLSATPAQGYLFVGWKESGQVVATDTSYTFTATRDRDLVAQFVPYGVLTVDIDPQTAIDDGAKWSIDGGVAWHNSGEDLKLASGDYTITFSDLTGWNTPAPLEVTIQPDAQVFKTGSYTRKTYSIHTTVSPENEGHQVTGGDTYYHGHGVTLMAIPAAGHSFVHWTEGNNIVSTDSTYFFHAKQDRSLLAHFASSNANLSGITLSEGSLDQVFSKDNLTPTASVGSDIQEITVTPTVEDAHATVKVNGTTVTSGNASDPISLDPGENDILIVVNAEDGTQKLYTMTVFRAYSYEIADIAAQTLHPLTYLYVTDSQETRNMTIKRTGTGHLENIAISLSGVNANAFQITQPIETVLDSVTNSTTFTIKAVNGLEAGNYQATVTISADRMDDVTFTIIQQVQKAAPTITQWPTTAAITYGQALSASQLENGLSEVSGLFSFKDTTLTPHSGTFDTEVLFTPTDTKNYNTLEKVISVEVLQKEVSITGSFFVKERQYNGTTTATITDNQLALVGTVNGDDVRLNSVAAFADSNIGVDKVVSLTNETGLIGTDVANYTLNLTGAPTSAGTITPKVLTLGGSFTVADKIYDSVIDAQITENSLTLHGIVGQEDVRFVNVEAMFTDKTVGADKTVTVQGTLDGVDASNYELSFNGSPTAAATITAKELTIAGSLSVNNKTYDGAATAEIIENKLNLVGIVNGDVVDLTDAKAVFNDRHVGSDKSIHISHGQLAGIDATNYTLSLEGSPMTIATITPKELTVGGSFTVADREYDGTTTANFSENNLSLIGIVNQDDVQLEPVISFTNKNVGEDILIVMDEASALSGQHAANYTLSIEGSPTTTATIMTGPPNTVALSMGVETVTKYDYETEDVIITAVSIVKDEYGHVVTDGRELGEFSLSAPPEAEKGVDYEFDPATGTLVIKKAAAHAVGPYTMTYTNILDASVETSDAITVLSSDANLIGLEAQTVEDSEEIKFHPDFQPSQTAYSTTVSYYIREINVVPTVSFENATVTVNSELVESKAKSQPIQLHYGYNEIDIKVIAEDSITTKTYTLSVYRRSKSSPKPQVDEIPLEVGMGDGDDLSNMTINRITEINGKIRDEILFNTEGIEDMIEQLTENGGKNIQVMVPDKEDKVSQVDFTIPEPSLKHFIDSETNLELYTDNLILKVSHAAIENFDEDVNVQIVPLKDKLQHQEVEERAKKNVKDKVGEQDMDVLGRPVMIDTNFQDREVALTLPLRGVPLPEDQLERKKFLDRLLIYVEHSDGSIEVIKPSYTEISKDVSGVSFTVSRFSTFSIIQLEEASMKNDLKAKPYITGFPDGTFRPNDTVTRAQMAVMIARNIGMDNYFGGSNMSFSDVENGDWSATAIQLVNDVELMEGTGDGYFLPEQQMSRAELAVVISRYLKLELPQKKASNHVFEDIENHWAAREIAAVKKAEIIDGFVDGTFRPDEPLTRAQAVKMINVMFDREPLPGVTTPTFTDVPTNHWAFKEIEEAVRTN